VAQHCARPRNPHANRRVRAAYGGKIEATALARAAARDAIRFGAKPLGRVGIGNISHDFMVLFRSDTTQKIIYD